MQTYQGKYCSISAKAKIGDNVSIGNFAVIEDDVIIGNNCKIGHRATIKSGTVIGDSSVFDDHCISTGPCYIGNNVNIRTGAIISKANIIDDNVFIGPGVVTNHTKHVNSKEQLITYIGSYSVVGSQASLIAGVFIFPNTIIGAGSVITKDLISGIYYGSPLQRKEIPQTYKISISINVDYILQKATNLVSKLNLINLQKFKDKCSHLAYADNGDL